MTVPRAQVENFRSEGDIKRRGDMVATHRGYAMAAGFGPVDQNRSGGGWASILQPVPTSKKRRHRKGGGRTQPRARDAKSQVGGEPDLVRDVRRALRGHPIVLLSLCSSLLELADPRRVSPMERSMGEAEIQYITNIFEGFLADKAALIEEIA